jgi:hypothetical protein
VAVLVKRFRFSSDTESWSFTTTSGADGSRDAGSDSPNDGTGGAIQSRRTGRNNTSAGNYWEWSGTWEDLGVPANSTITGVNGHYDWRCSEYVTGTGVNQSGPFELRDSSGTTVRHTFSAAQGSVSGTTSWATASGTAATSLTDASTTGLRLRATNNLRTGNNASAAVTIQQDYFDLSITYEESGGSSEIDETADVDIAKDINIASSVVVNDQISEQVTMLFDTMGNIEVEETLYD